MYIFLAIIAFGVLIFVHELGHFLAAKACGVKVTEFAIGMGPRIVHTARGETVYSFRALPVGGFCAMEGEDGDSRDPRAFSNQSVIRRLLILCAGSFMNFLLGFVLLLIIYLPAQAFVSTTIVDFFPDCPYADTLQPGDEIRRINGQRVYFLSNFSEFMAKDDDGTVDLELRRDGKKLVLRDYHLVPVPYPTEDGGTEMKYGLYFGTEEATFFTKARTAWYECLDFVRLVRSGLSQLFHGQAAVTDMTGVVGIVDLINETGQSADTTAEGVEYVGYLVAFIAVNLSVMNMLPIPALDGGHILTVLLAWGYEKLTGKKPDPRIEGYIHFAGLILLLGLMVFIFFNDIVRIIRR